jgi:tetratricopeptide (TPR) repeat protein
VRSVKPVGPFAGHAALAAGRYQDAADAFDHVLRGLRPPRAGAPAIGAFTFEGVARAFLGEFGPAADAFSSAERQIESHGGARQRRLVELGRGIAALQQARWADAAALLEPLEGEAARDGDAFAEGMAGVFAAWALAAANPGRDESARADRGLAVVETLGPMAGQSLWIAAHAEALRISGDLARAQAAAGRALTLASAGDRWGEILAERTLGQCLMGGVEIDAEEVAGHLERAVTLATERGARADLALGRFRLAELYALLDEWEPCRVDLDQTSWLSLGLEMDWLRDQAAALRQRLPPKARLPPPVPQDTVS